MSNTRLSGVIAAVPTPYDGERRIDIDAFLEHARFCLENGCDALNVLGTTGEANSLSTVTRKLIMREAARDLDPCRLMVGTGTPALDPTVELPRHAHALGFKAALVLPPYYYKPLADDALFAWFSALMAMTATAPIGLYLYNFPQLTGLTFSRALAARLREAFPERMLGAKDSSGNLDYACELARIKGFDVFPSNEASLADAARDGFAGCISATVNVDPAAAQSLWRNQQDEALRGKVLALRQAVSARPLIPAVKYLAGRRSGHDTWLTVSPPLLPLTSKDKAALDPIHQGLKTA